MCSLADRLQKIVPIYGLEYPELTNLDLSKTVVLDQKTINFSLCLISVEWTKVHSRTMDSLCPCSWVPEKCVYVKKF